MRSTISIALISILARPVVSSARRSGDAAAVTCAFQLLHLTPALLPLTRPTRPGLLQSPSAPHGPFSQHVLCRALKYRCSAACTLGSEDPRECGYGRLGLRNRKAHIRACSSLRSLALLRHLGRRRCLIAVASARLPHVCLSPMHARLLPPNHSDCLRA
ncbi:hypothetical protein BV20DRAFT_49286 [Pilatotrama ljubarskyi]|nr:hypothetical protein BV20DRAFT_49286 [Pilatotrama ljubarskyi]